MGVWGWWAFDIFTLISSYLSVDIISAQTIMRSLGLLTFMIPVGFSVACGILVGRSIGQGSEAAIKHYYSLCMMLSIGVAFLQVVFLLIFESLIIEVFTNIERISVHIKSAWLIFCLFVVFDTT